MTADGQPGVAVPATRGSAGTVLVVDDDADTRQLARHWLAASGFEVIEAASGPEALDHVRAAPDGFSAILLDIMMPGMDGYEVLGNLRADPDTEEIPVVIFTGAHNVDEDIVRGMEAGALGYVSKPFTGPLLVAQVRALSGRRSLELTLRSQLSAAEAEARTDSLTGLFNRRQFQTQLQVESSYARRHRTPLTLLVLDIDHFKAINDRFGHEAGDAVLSQFAKVVSRTLRLEDQAFRIGGEEFAVLLRATHVDSSMIVAHRLRQALRSRPIELGDEPYVIRFSAGVAALDASNDFQSDGLFKQADAALYQAKRDGRDRAVLAGARPAV